MAREIKQPLTLAFLFLAILGWLAAALSFWHQPNGEEQQPRAQVKTGEDQDKVLTQVNAAQQRLATVQSALSQTTRLRDEAVEALQEVRARSAPVKKDLTLASNQLDDIQQKIVANNAELTTISKRLETARLREALDKRKADSSSGAAAPLAASTVTNISKEGTGSTHARKDEPGKSDTLQTDHGSTPAGDHDQQQAATQAEAVPKRLATVESALAQTTRLRDEAAQALQEVRARSAEVKKDLAAAREKLDDMQQKITARNAELTTINKRLDTARLRESQEKQMSNASARSVAPATPLVDTTVAVIPNESPAPTPATTATGSPSPSTAASPPAPADAATEAVAPAPAEPAASPPKANERQPSPSALISPPDARVPTSASKPSAEPSPEPVPTPARKTQLAGTGGTSAVIGPGDLSSPSDFELQSGRGSRTKAPSSWSKRAAAKKKPRR